MRYRKKPIVIEATQWFKNGDHPQDYANNRVGIEAGNVRTWTGQEAEELEWEVEIVRYF